MEGNTIYAIEGLFDASITNVPSMSEISVVLLIADLVPWLKLLPNVTWLNIELSELKCWLNEETIGEDIHFFLERLERISVTCTSMDESMLDKLLAFFVESGHFSRMRRLCFVDGCT